MPGDRPTVLTAMAACVGVEPLAVLMLSQEPPLLVEAVAFH